MKKIFSLLSALYLLPINTFAQVIDVLSHLREKIITAGAKAEPYKPQKVEKLGITAKVDLSGLPQYAENDKAMAVQHGQAQIPIHSALGTNSNISSWSDEEIINALYDARTNYMAGIHYTDPNDIKKQQNIIYERYPKERKRALDALKIKY